jgi:hypothetical protein
MGHLTPSLNQTITFESIYAAAPVDLNGDPSYNTGVSYPARIERRIKKVTTLQGQEAVSSTLIILDGNGSLDEFGRDRITLPVNMGSKQPIILSIEDARDQSGVNDHWEVST